MTLLLQAPLEPTPVRKVLRLLKKVRRLLKKVRVRKKGPAGSEKRAPQEVVSINKYLKPQEL